MAGARIVRIIATDTKETHDILVSMGDSIRGQEWAKENVADAPKPDLSPELSEDERAFNRELYLEARAAVEHERQYKGGLYGIYLGAKRAKVPHSELDFLEFADYMTFEDDEAEDTAPVEPGESSEPSSAS